MNAGKIIVYSSLLLLWCARLYPSHDSLAGQSAEQLIRFCLKNHQSNPSATLHYAKLALRKSRQENNELHIGRAYEMIGVSEDYLGNFDSALVYFDTSAVYLKKQAEQLPYARLSAYNFLHLYS